MLIPEEVIQDILVATDIVEVAQGFTVLQASGAHYTGLCPFHEEDTPSFVVSPRRQLFTCFGCHEHGNVLWLVMRCLSLDFAGAVAHLAARAEVELPGWSDDAEPE
jgi:DNA primase